ncbi:hypothetical protein N9818_00075 [Arcobacteraceae bacterium]|nr:hypothetical protein [Arcobacteraceae bacterium]
MKLKISDKVNRINESLTISISTLASKLKEEGKDILTFSVGEPDFNIPHS